MSLVTLQNAVDNTNLTWIKDAAFRVATGERTTDKFKQRVKHLVKPMTIGDFQASVPECCCPEWVCRPFGFATDGDELMLELAGGNSDNMADLAAATVFQWGPRAWVRSLEKTTAEIPKALLSHPAFQNCIAVVAGEVMKNLAEFCRRAASDFEKDAQGDIKGLIKAASQGADFANKYLSKE